MQEKCSKVFTLFSIFDSPARCLVQNVKQFNGEYGCNWCYAKGEQVERGLGTARVYPVQNEPSNKRTHDSMIADGLEASKEGRSSHKGVKGLSPLLAFTYFNMVSGFGVDYMHCVLLGVCLATF
ncbi:hypothetical protein HOLleu_26903 [Holothuria leucospilota]|uniref:Uncharacterized protein n=1 Tax=Holothuria leucospilota TaxID=206669 RepID=A0A9Q1BP87_HOLLE|nr:hypothetical protein HOLleu_26903 [Holothuria leucospilota]